MPPDFYPLCAASATARVDALARFTPSIDESRRTSVLVLGTPHLTAVEGFEREMLETLLAALEEWAPDAVCVETLPGRTIATMLAEEDAYGPVLAQFVGGAVDQARWAQQHLGLGYAGAVARLRAAREPHEPVLAARGDQPLGLPNGISAAGRGPRRARDELGDLAGRSSQYPRRP